MTMHNGNSRNNCMTRNGNSNRRRNQQLVISISNVSNSCKYHSNNIVHITGSDRPEPIYEAFVVGVTFLVSVEAKGPMVHRRTPVTPLPS